MEKKEDKPSVQAKEQASNASLMDEQKNVTDTGVARGQVGNTSQDSPAAGGEAAKVADDAGIAKDGPENIDEDMQESHIVCEMLDYGEFEIDWFGEQDDSDDDELDDEDYNNNTYTGI